MPLSLQCSVGAFERTSTAFSQAKKITPCEMQEAKDEEESYLAVFTALSVCTHGAFGQLAGLGVAALVCALL